MSKFKRRIEQSGKRSSDSRFARSHEADQDDIHFWTFRLIFLVVLGQKLANA